jgi:hypothetical protein
MGKGDEPSLVRINRQSMLVTPPFHSMQSPLHEPRYHVWEFTHCQETNVIRISLCIDPPWLVAHLQPGTIAGVIVRPPVDSL